MTLYKILSGGLHGRYEGDAKDSEGKLLQRELVVYGPATMADGKPRPSHDTDGNLNPGFAESEDGSVTVRDVIDLTDAEAKSPSFRGRIGKIAESIEKVAESQPEKAVEKSPSTSQKQPVSAPASAPVPTRPVSQPQSSTQHKS